MDLREKSALLPTVPGVYLYKDAEGRVLYVGKAKNLRNRVRGYFNEDRLAEAKTGTAHLRKRATSTTSRSTTRRKLWRSRTT